MKSISTQSLSQGLAKEPPLQVINVITVQHLQAEHLPDAENTCVYEISFVDSIS